MTGRPGSTERPGSSASDDPFRDFTSRRGKAVATALAIVAVVLFTMIGAFIPDTGITQWRVADRIMLASIGYVLAAFFWRYATIKAVPSRTSLRVRNLFTTREVEWTQIVGLQFGGGMPWVQLELNDTDTVAVMAIQRADGPRADAEASRLAALVTGLGEAREPDPGG